MNDSNKRITTMVAAAAKEGTKLAEVVAGEKEAEDAEVVVDVDVGEATATATTRTKAPRITANPANQWFPTRRETEKREPMSTPFPRRPGLNLPRA